MLKIPPHYWLILPIALLVTFGQLLAKWRSLTAGYGDAGATELQMFGKLVTDPVMIAAYGVGFLANIGWLYVLTKVPLTIGLPAYLGLTFAMVLLGGWMFLGEPLSAQTVIAVLLIFAGVLLAVHGDASR